MRFQAFECDLEEFEEISDFEDLSDDGQYNQTHGQFVEKSV